MSRKFIIRRRNIIIASPRVRIPIGSYVNLPLIIRPNHRIGSCRVNIEPYYGVGYGDECLAGCIGFEAVSTPLHSTLGEGRKTACDPRLFKHLFLSLYIIAWLQSSGRRFLRFRSRRADVGDALSNRKTQAGQDVARSLAAVEGGHCGVGIRVAHGYKPAHGINE